MDALRKQLDALMGANRNGDVREVKRKYYDRDVCRLYLTGLCPHDLFQLTKMDLGPCSKFHSLQLRKEYEEAKAQGKDSYDRELEECLEKHILECDRKIARALKRLEDDDVGAATAIAVSEVTKSSDACEYTRQIKEKLKEAEYLDLEGKTDEKIRILEVVEELRSKRADRQAMSLLEAFSKDRALMPQPLPNPPPLAPLPMMAASAPDARTQELIKQKLKVAEELGEQGRVDEAEKAMEEAEALKKLGSRQDLSADPSKVATQDVRVADQKLRVCDICGAFLSIYDSDRRLADHFGGKLHLGYMQIREKLVDLKEQRTRHLNEKDGHDDKGRGRDGQSNSDEQERDWGKVKDQEKDRQGSRVQEPEHQNRGRDKDGDREPEFRRGYLASGRDGDRGRDRKRRREREDDRERDDDGNRHGGRYVDRNYKDRSHTEQGHNRFYRHRTGGYRDGDRDRDGDNRDRDRDRDRWERDRERNREKEKERDRDRAKEKERDRGPVERDRARDRD